MYTIVCRSLVDLAPDTAFHGLSMLLDALLSGMCSNEFDSFPAVHLVDRAGCVFEMVVSGFVLLWVFALEPALANQSHERKYVYTESRRKYNKSIYDFSTLPTLLLFMSSYVKYCIIVVTGIAASTCN